MSTAEAQATAAAAAASLEVLRQELVLLREEQKTTKKINEDLAKEQKAARALARKAAIERECDKYPSKGVKRVVKKSLETLDFIADIKALWEDLANEAEDGVVATQDNVALVNKAIEGQSVLLDDLEEHVRWELECNTSAATSEIGWRAVDQLELERKRKKDKEDKVLIKPEDLRAAEKNKISFEKDLRSVIRGSAAIKGRGGNKRTWVSMDKDGEASGAGSQKGGRGGWRGRGRGGASKSKDGCFRCGKDHMVRDCPVPLPQ